MRIECLGGVWTPVHDGRDTLPAVPELKRCGDDCPVRTDGRQVEFVEVGLEAVKSDVLEVFSDVWPILIDDLKLPSSAKVRWFAPKSYGVKALGVAFKARHDLLGFAETDVWLRAGQPLRQAVATLAHEARHRAGGGERESERYAAIIVDALYGEVAA